MNLDPEKQSALSHKGNVLVTANPGTGKTFLLAQKYVDLVKEGLKTDEILCLTFTNKAMREMENRIVEKLESEKIDADLSKLNVYTFHSYALEYLDESDIISTNLLRFVIYEYLKKNEVFTYGDEYLVSDVVPRLENLMRYLKSYGITSDKIDVQKTRELLLEFERSKGVIEKEDLEKFLVYFVEIFDLYEKEKAKKGIDYADLLINFLKLKNKPKFKHVLIDELQDVNELEARIALESGETFFAVGDKKQAIFGFQGGSIGNFRLFEEKKPLMQNLTSNRRSTQQILDFAATDFKNKTIDEAGKKELDGLKSFEKKQGEKPRIIEAQQDETIGTLCSLLNKIEGENIAVVARTNSQIMKIGKELENRNIEFSSTCVASSLEAKENIIKFLKAVFSNDIDDVKTAFYTPFFPINIRKAFELTAKKGITLEQILEECPEFKEIRENQKDIETVTDLFVKRIFPIAIAYGEEYLLSAQTMLKSSQEALKLINDKTLPNFVLYLEASDLVASTAKKDAKITLTTVHKSKGLQYDTVIYIPKKTKNKRSFYDYIVEKVLEANGRKEEFELEEETLRINFVAFTRAKKELYMITENAMDYANENAEKMELEAEELSHSFEEKKKRAYTLFINKNYDEAKQLLEENNAWLKDFVKKHFDSMEHISFSRLTTNPYEYFTKNILQLRQITYATNLGSAVHELLRSYLEGKKTEPKEEEKQYFENGVELIKKIQKDYPEFVKAEHKIYLPLNTIIETTEKLHFKGYIDAIFKNKDEYLLVDWKTSKDTKDASKNRRQLELYKRAYSQETGIPPEKIKVAIAFIGLRKIINDGNIIAEMDSNQPRKNVFDTIKKHLEKFLEWKQKPETFFEDLKAVKVDDPLIRSLIEQYETETNKT